MHLQRIGLKTHSNTSSPSKTIQRGTTGSMGSPVRPVCGRNRRRSDLTSTKPQRLGTCTCHYGHSPTSRYDARQLDLKKWTMYYSTIVRQWVCLRHLTWTLLEQAWLIAARDLPLPRITKSRRPARPRSRKRAMRFREQIVDRWIWKHG